jgi:transcriptional regulator GlxA family with amidase domain
VHNVSFYWILKCGFGTKDNMPTYSAKGAQAERRVVFVLFDNVKLLDVTGPMQVFCDANELIGRQAYVTSLASLYGGPVQTDTGVVLNAQQLGGIGLDQPDTLMVCGGDGVFDARRDTRLIAALQRSSAQCGRTASTCTGAFLLGAAGLLSGRRAVTHWQRCDELARACPDAEIDPDPIFIEDNGIWTSAGVTAGIDLALAMVEKDHGNDLALKLARELLVYVKRPGGQAQFSESLKQQTLSASGRFDALHFWMRDNLTADLRVDALAERCGISPRSFARLYVSDMHETPARMVERVRVTAARSRLEDARQSIKTIAVECGFGSDERMRRSFIRQLGLSPQAYRRRFSKMESEH